MNSYCYKITKKIPVTYYVRNTLAISWLIGNATTTSLPLYYQLTVSPAWPPKVITKNISVTYYIPNTLVISWLLGNVTAKSPPLHCRLHIWAARTQYNVRQYFATSYENNVRIVTLRYSLHNSRKYIFVSWVDLVGKVKKKVLFLKLFIFCGIHVGESYF